MSKATLETLRAAVQVPAQFNVEIICGGRDRNVFTIAESAAILVAPVLDEGVIVCTHASQLTVSKVWEHFHRRSWFFSA